MSELLKTYTEAQKNKEVAKAQSEAIRAKKLGESLVPQVIKMVDNGKQLEAAHGFTHFIQKQMNSQPSHKINYESTTMALNAELKQAKPGIEASVYEVSPDMNDPAFTKSAVEINKIDGQEVRTKAS